MASPAIPQSTNRLTFLGIPRELRLMIFLNMITWSIYDHLSVLCVSKQIQQEAQESFDKRSILGISQCDFVKKVRKLLPVFLEKMNVVSIRFEDNGNPYFSPSGIAQPYVGELDKLYHALGKLPNLHTFMATAPANKRAYPRKYMTRLLRWLSTHHRTIEVLGMGISCAMGVLPQFHQLRELSYSGFSATSERGLGNIFARLHRLESLEILCYERLRYQNSGILIAPSAIARIRPLKRLSIREEYKYEDEGRMCGCAILYSSDICKAFEQTHGQSLESLTITCRNVGGRSFLVPMYSLLRSATSLKTLTLKLWEFDAYFLWKLSSGLESLDLSLRRRSLGLELAYFNSIHAKFPLLRSSCFTLNPLITVENGQVVESIHDEEVFRFESCDFGQSRSLKWAPGWPQ